MPVGLTQGFYMNKQRLFSFLSLLGLIFMAAVLIGYVVALDNRGKPIAHSVEVPDIFAAEFSRVVTKNRFEEMVPASFVDPKGQQIGWEVFDGQYLLVNFWASWCGPCVVELPSLEKLQKKFAGKGLEVIAISIDQGRNHAQIKEYLKNRYIGQFAAYWDDQENVQKSVYMRGIPTTYLLGPKGNVLHIFEGDADWADPVSIDFFSKLLNS